MKLIRQSLFIVNQVYLAIYLYYVGSQSLTLTILVSMRLYNSRNSRLVLKFCWFLLSHGCHLHYVRRTVLYNFISWVNLCFPPNLQGQMEVSQYFACLFLSSIFISFRGYHPIFFFLTLLLLPICYFDQTIYVIVPNYSCQLFFGYHIFPSHLIYVNFQP